MSQQIQNAYVVINQVTGVQKTAATYGAALAFAQYMNSLGQKWEVVGP